MHDPHDGTGGVSHSEVAWAGTGGSGTLRPVEKLWIGGKELSTNQGLYYHNAVNGQEAEVNSTAAGANASLDPTSRILTLNGLNVQTTEEGICWGEENNFDYRNLVLQITGDNLIHASKTGIAGRYGKDGNGPSLRIEGNGSLTVTSEASGIWVWKDITIEETPTINITARVNGIANNFDVTSQGGITIKDGELTVKGETRAMGLAPTFYLAKYSVTASKNSDGSGAGTYDETALPTYKYLKFTKAATDPVGIYLRTIGTDQQDISVPTDQRSSLGTPYYYSNWVDYGTFASAKAASFDETQKITYDGEDVKAVIAEMKASTISKKSGVGFSNLDKVVWDTLSWSQNASGPNSWHLNGAIVLCKVKFELNYPDDATGKETEPATRYAIRGIDINTGFPEAPSCENYTFDGWYLSKDGAGKITQIPELNDDVTYYAHWSAKNPRNYSVTLNLDGGTLEAGKNVTSYTYGTAVTLPIPTKEGYNFGGWYDNSSCTGNPVTEITATDTENKEFWAHWTEKPAHNHSWAYSKTAEDTIAAACTSTAGTCDYQTTPATLTISMDKDVYAYDVNMTAPKATLTHSANWPSDLAEAKESGIKYWKSTDGGSSYSVQITTPDGLKAVGKYLAQLKFNDKYIDVKFSVVDYSRKDPIYTPPTAKKSLVYNGKNQALINKGTVQGGTMYYRLGTDSTSSVLVPAPISAATYDVYYKIIGDEGYNDVAEQRITVTISKAALTGTPTFTPVTEAGKKLADVKLTAPVDWPVGSFSWKPAGETTSQDTEITKGTSYRWIFIPNDTTNYTGIDGDLVLWSRTGGISSSGGGYYTPSSAVTTSGSTSGKVTSSPTEVKRETKTDANGSSVTTATVTVSAANQREILRQVKANKSGEIVIKISKNDVKDAAKIALQLEKSFIEAVVTDTDAKLIIQTPDGERTFTQDELKKLAAEATDKIVTVDPAEAEQAQPEQPADTLTPAQEKLVKGVENTNIDLRSQRTPGGNILLTWAKEKGYKVDYFEIYRSTKRSSGYGRKPFFRTPNGNWTKYLNTKNIKEGSTYYYKIRGVRIIDGKKYYTEYSTKAWRSVK